MVRAVLIGNYGQANFGDEALREYFVSRFPECEWSVLVAGKPAAGECARLPLGMRSILRPWWRTIGVLRRADIVIFGGGTLYTDIESLQACLLWGWHALVARFLRVPYVLAAQGVGPFRTRLGERIARSVYRNAVAVSVRDGMSLERVRSWGMNTSVVRVFDPVFSLFKAIKIDTRSQDVLIVIPRLNSGEAFDAALRQQLASGKFSSCRIVSMEPDHPEERRRCAHLRTVASVPVETAELRSSADVPSALRGAGLVLTQRYHGGILARAAGLPFVGVPQAEGDKIDALKRETEDAGLLLEYIATLERQLGRFLLEGKGAGI